MPDSLVIKSIKTSLTLWENSWGGSDGHCGNGASELTPQQFSTQKLLPEVRASIDYVFVSWYPEQCISPPLPDPNVPEPTIEAEMVALHALYPNAKLGFGEIGLKTAANTVQKQIDAKALATYYYSLDIPLSYYVGAYFWWYFADDGVPKDVTSGSIWDNIHDGMATY